MVRASGPSKPLITSRDPGAGTALAAFPTHGRPGRQDIRGLRTGPGPGRPVSHRRGGVRRPSRRDVAPHFRIAPGRYVAGGWPFGCTRIGPHPVRRPPSSMPDFKLTDQQGGRTAPGDLRGRVGLVFFGFTNCMGICPATLQVLRRQATRELGPDAADLRIVLISVDPARDTPAAMQAFLEPFGAGFVGLTGEPADQGVADASEPSTSRACPVRPASYDVEHDAGLPRRPGRADARDFRGRIRRIAGQLVPCCRRLPGEQERPSRVRGRLRARQHRAAASAGRAGRPLTLSSGPYGQSPTTVGGGWLSPATNNWPIIAIHAALTPDGRVLTTRDPAVRSTDPRTSSDIWDPGRASRRAT